MISKNKLKILVVDDSAVIRQTLISIISSQSDMEVIATATDPYIAVGKLKSEKPDVILLDIQMPRMDGITFLKKIMTQHPVPVIIISSLTRKDSKVALSAFKYGAIDVINKPEMSSGLLSEKWKENLIDAIKAAANSKFSRNKISLKKDPELITKITKLTTIGKIKCNSFILIGSSAGGTEVIFKIISQLNKRTAPILIVQHMPSIFTQSYAERLNEHSEVVVREAVSGDELYRGLALIAPGNKHMELNNKLGSIVVNINSKDKVNRHRPSVDVLFNSSINMPGSKIMAIILSGMGDDGSKGMLKLKEVGAITIAQNRESSIVFGMPQQAIKTGAADHELSIDEIVKMINKFSAEI